MHFLDVMALLALALILAKLLGGVFEKFRIPGILAELLTGVALGNLGALYGMPFACLETSPIINALSELGVLLLLFVVGLETKLEELTEVAKDATRVALAGVFVPFVLAFLVVPWVSAPSSLAHALFIAAALTATSVGVTARVLRDARRLRDISGRIILGAAVVDDVLGIVLLTIVSSLSLHAEIGLANLFVLAVKILGFCIGTALVRALLLPHLLKMIRPLEISGSVVIWSLSLCLLAAWMAEKAGLAGLIGAFSMGVILDDVHFRGYRETENVPLERLVKPVTDFLAPVFFIVVGMRVKLDTFAHSESVLLGLVLIACAILGKWVCGLAVSPLAKKKGADRHLVGLGMIPRGEVGLIFAAQGLSLGVLSSSDYGAVVAMVAVTTLFAPLLVSLRIRHQAKK